MNLNLAGPRAWTQWRVVYGTFGSTGIEPTRRRTSRGGPELRNKSRNRAYQISGRVEKRFTDGMAATAHYTFSRVRDVQTPLRVNTLGFVNWSSRAVSGRHEDLSTGISLNDIPHRIVLAATARAPWRRWSTELAVYYVGESGSPFTYLAWGAVRGRGDLNADGSNENDPIYVPRTAFDTAQIRFSPTIRQVPVPGGGTRMDPVTESQQAAASSDSSKAHPVCAGSAARSSIAKDVASRGSPHGCLGATVDSRREARTGSAADITTCSTCDSDWGRYRVALHPTRACRPDRGTSGVGTTLFRYNVAAPRGRRCRPSRRSSFRSRSVTGSEGRGARADARIADRGAGLPGEGSRSRGERGSRALRRASGR